MTTTGDVELPRDLLQRAVHVVAAEHSRKSSSRLSRSTSATMRMNSNALQPSRTVWLC